MPTPDHVPSTTPAALLAAIEPDANEPWDAMNVPPSDACDPFGVSATLARFRPQIAIRWPVAPAAAWWLAGVETGHALPGVGVLPTTAASRISNVRILAASPPVRSWRGGSCRSR